MNETLTGLSFLSAMITPAVLISACGTLVFSTSTRLADTWSLDLTYAGEAESDEGRADIVEAKFMNATFRVFVDKESHLPLMVSWREPAPRFQTLQRAPGAPPPSQDERDRMMREARERAEKEPPKMADIVCSL